MKSGIFSFGQNVMDSVAQFMENVVTSSCFNNDGLSLLGFVKLQTNTVIGVCLVFPSFPSIQDPSRNWQHAILALLDASQNISIP